MRQLQNIFHSRGLSLWFIEFLWNHKITRNGSKLMILSKCHFNDVKSKKNKIDMHKSEVLKSLKWAMKANIMNKCFTSPRRDDYGKCAMIFFQAWSDMLNTHTCSYIYMLYLYMFIEMFFSHSEMSSLLYSVSLFDMKSSMESHGVALFHYVFLWYHFKIHIKIQFFLLFTFFARIWHILHI